MIINEFPQTVPQAIMAGTDIGAMTREQLKQFIITQPAGRVAEARTRVAFLVEGAKRTAKWGIS